MLAGHFAVAFAAKRLAPRTSLATLFVAAQLLDLLWPWFVIAGIEHFSIAPAGSRIALVFDHYPWSHSLLLAAAWAALAGAAFALLRRDARGAAVISALVLSHWLLDVVVHVPDLPLAPGSPVRAGLGLWNFPLVEFFVELAMLVAGAAIYARATRALRGAGTWGLWLLVAFIAAILAGSAFGPPPPGTMAVVWTDMTMWLLVLWAWWCDRARTPR
jgi:hypothetical protein